VYHFTPSRPGAVLNSLDALVPPLDKACNKQPKESQVPATNTCTLLALYTLFQLASSISMCELRVVKKASPARGQNYSYAKQILVVYGNVLFSRHLLTACSFTTAVCT
jgi:hypothetical protein